jgi:manganese transport protein
LLIFSQVVLSLQLGFAVIPLIHFVSDKKTMGEFAIGKWIKVLSWIIASILVYLNGNLVIDFAIEFLQGDAHFFLKAVLVSSITFFVGLLLYIIIYPLLLVRLYKDREDLHGSPVELDWEQTAPIKRIAIAVDFSNADSKLIKTALGQANPSTEFIFIHIVESVTARYFQESSDDEESRNDRERLAVYAKALEEKGFTVSTVLGFNNRVAEIVRIVAQSNAQLLVMGAHKHHGWKDYIFGETIESVRHKVQIPVLIVNY